MTNHNILAYPIKWVIYTKWGVGRCQIQLQMCVSERKQDVQFVDDFIYVEKGGREVILLNLSICLSSGSQELGVI